MYANEDCILLSLPDPCSEVLRESWRKPRSH